jgi:hypothetical protein
MKRYSWTGSRIKKSVINTIMTQLIDRTQATRLCESFLAEIPPLRCSDSYLLENSTLNKNF